jgi:hypothetical protein
MLDALLGVAALRAREGDTESALELVLHVIRDPARTQDVHNRAEHLRVEWEARLAAQHIDVIRARLQSKTLDAVVQELLDAL